RRLEQAHRPTLAHHVHRTAPMGPWVLINENWYYLRQLNKLAQGEYRNRFTPQADSRSSPKSERSASRQNQTSAKSWRFL
ncbi:hypothetical protein, partial [Methylobacterium sp. Leaf399]|uniref:hypothetical protein n=1 Tax=Methylobacterium sp. Leaf399 TaxID=1736364 RepID=UPI001AEC13DE